jgi:hypothetical protein
MTRTQAINELNLPANWAGDMAELKKAYRAACLKSHPDKGGSAIAFKRTSDAYAILSGNQAATATAQPAPKPQPAPKVKAYGNPKISREDWLHTAYAHVEAHAKLAGIDIPSIRLSVGYGFAGRRNTKGWEVVKKTRDNVPQAFVSPTLDDAADVLPALIAATGKIAGKDVAAGLEAIWTIAGSEVAKAMGKYPHAAANDLKTNKPQTTRLLKVVCPACGYVVRVSAKWAQVGMPKCCCGTKMKLA